MSNIYTQEPPTSGKVVLKTTHGEIEIELWTKEAPKACKNFIQLCFERYYDNTVFHRLIPQFMIQGGDPTGTGEGGESIYGHPFSDEYHQRLKFSHRGIVAMATAQQHQNGSQFFMTFDKCEWLNKKHTIFGKVVGDTLFNLLSMENLDTDQNDRPVNAPSILSTKVLINPFDDISVRDAPVEVKLLEESKKQETKAKEQEQKMIKKKKGKKNINLLSFQEDEIHDQQDQKKVISSHDVLNDKKLSKEPAVSQQKQQAKEKLKQEEFERQQKLKAEVKYQTNQKNNDWDQNIKDNLIKKKRHLETENPGISKIIQEENPHNKQILNGAKTRINKKTGKIEVYWEESQSESDSEEYSSTDSEEFINEEQRDLRQKQKEEYENLKIDFLQLKKNKKGTNIEEQAKEQKEEKQILSSVELQRMKFLNKKRIEQHEKSLLERLDAFKQKLNSEEVQSNKQSWLNNRLKFHIDSQRAYSNFNNKEKSKNIKQHDSDDELIIVDPLKRIKENEIKNKKLDDMINLDSLMDMTK